MESTVSSCRSIGSVINYIKSKIKSNKNLLKTLNNKVEEAKELNKNKVNSLINSEAYKQSFDSIEMARRTNSSFKQYLTTLQSDINEYIDIINNIDKKTDEFAGELNKNKLSYGLQGQLKHQLKGKTENMTEPQKMVLESDYMTSPFENINIGGKTKKRRKNKRRKNKRRKTRKHYKK